jgi:hypothetical protein
MNRLLFSSIRVARISSSSMAINPDRNTRIRETPRISANDLARYMVAGDVGRRGIIRRSREVSTAVVVRYSDARTGLQSALCDLVNERRILAATRNMLDQKANDMTNSAFAREDALKSIDVLDSYAAMRNQLAGNDFVAAPARQPIFRVGGVDISVNCDVLTQRDVRSIASIGGVLFRLTKPEDEESEAARAKRIDMGSYAATLVFMQVRANLAGTRQPRPDLCWSVDVQHGEVHPAPRNYRTRAANLEAACEVIAAMWDRV